MRLQPKNDSFIVQKEFLHTTSGLQHKVGGGTLKASTFTADATGHVKAGSCVIVRTSDGFVVPQDGGTTGGKVYILAHDVFIGDGDAVAGLLETAYLKKSVVQTVETGRVVASDTIIAHANAENRFKLR